MEHDHFASLGLAPGEYAPGELAAQFAKRRASLAADMNDPAAAPQARQALEELHVAYAILRNPAAQRELLARRRAGEERSSRVAALIAASLEDGLLRYSRRQQILDAGRRAGLSDFQTQLLIAQVQFDAPTDTVPAARVTAPAAIADAAPPSSRIWARYAAAGLLSVAMLLAALRALGV